MFVYLAVISPGTSLMPGHSQQCPLHSHTNGIPRTANSHPEGEVEVPLLSTAMAHPRRRRSSSSRVLAKHDFAQGPVS